jgi:hypothetical protein
MNMNARQDASSKDHFDLLPFIAILMCVLGCLLLVTMSIAALSIGPGLGEGWIPSADESGASKVPVLIEWDGQTAVVHADGKKTPLRWERRQSKQIQIGGQTFELLVKEEKPSATRAAFEAFLDGIARKNRTHYALLAVRPSGFESFGRFSDEFRRKEITIGFEPIEQDKPVRLINTRGKP